uniref:Putative ixodes 8-cys protein n=1 Tax=Ixodes ricinus TaxID=34613 RepID=A0A0K8R934_IXORI
MFTLKFFILFVLAGLCFGDTSDSGRGSSSEVDGGSSSNTQGNTASDDQEQEKKEVGSAGKATNDNGNDGKEGSGVATNPGKHAGYGLPGFIGDEGTRKLYLNDLVKQCGEISVWKVNEGNITASLSKCTYICVKKNDSSATKELRIPKDKVCGPNQAKCGETGECPVIVPSC